MIISQPPATTPAASVLHRRRCGAVQRRGKDQRREQRQRQPPPAASTCRAAAGGRARPPCATIQTGGDGSDSQTSAPLVASSQPHVPAQEQPVTPTPLPAQPQRAPQLWRTMLQTCVSLVHRNLWPLLTAHAIADAAVFLLHRISHRATNEGAQLVGAPARQPERGSRRGASPGTDR